MTNTKTHQPEPVSHLSLVRLQERTNQGREVTHYQAWFDGSFVHVKNAVSLDKLRDACPKYNQNLAMQPINLTLVLGELEATHPGILSLVERPVLGEAQLDKTALVLNGEFTVASLADHREKMTRAIAIRRGQPAFRAQLLECYGNRCPVTGCDAVEALEACHIVGYKGEETHHVQNGVLLRADIHSLFDRGLLGIDLAFYVWIHPALRDTVYGELHGRKLELPKDQTTWPSADALKHQPARVFLP